MGISIYHLHFSSGRNHSKYSNYGCDSEIQQIKVCCKIILKLLFLFWTYVNFIHRFRNLFVYFIFSLCASDLLSACISPLFWYRRTLGFDLWQLPDFLCKVGKTSCVNMTFADGRIRNCCLFLVLLGCWYHDIIFHRHAHRGIWNISFSVYKIPTLFRKAFKQDWNSK